MNKTFSSQPNLRRQLYGRLRTIGVSKPDAKATADWIQLQITSMGPEGALAYLKNVGDCLVWAITGSGSKPKWVKTRDRFPVHLHHLRDKYDERVLLRIAKIARSIRFEEVTETQVAKVLPAVTKPYSGTEQGRRLLTALICSEARLLTFDSHVSWSPTDYPFIGKRFSRVTSVSYNGLIEKPLASPPLEESLRIVKSLTFLQALPEWEKVFSPLIPDSVRLAVNAMEFGGPWVGEIHASQEGGGKLRMFASPYQVIQCLLTPIHDFLDKWRATLKTDCTYDQLSGAYWAQTQLKNGLTVHSVDLSTATCRFPFGPQEEMLRVLGLPEPHIEAFRRVSKGTWKVGDELLPFFKVKTLRWNTGQPLGIIPSMSCFSLAHNLLLNGLCRIHDVMPEDTFRVLGDDVVIVHDGVANMYRDVISSAGIPISWNKSHSGNTYAEFAGCSITRNTVIRPGKWSPVSHKNAVELSILFESPLKHEVTIKFRQALKLILFDKGLYTPSSDRLEFYHQKNREFRSLGGEPPVLKTSAPFWVYAMRELWTELWIKLGLQKKTGLLPGFIPENPSALDAFRFPEVFEHQSLKPYFWSSAVFADHNIELCFSMFMCFVEAAVEDGLDPSTAFEIIAKAEQRMYSMLFVPPRKSGPRLHSWIERALRILNEENDSIETIGNSSDDEGAELVLR